MMDTRVSEGINTNSGGLEGAQLQPYQGPLSATQASHFLKRTSFCGTPADVAALTGRSAIEVVNEAVDAAINMSYPQAPSWVNNYPPPRSAPLSVRQQYNSDNNDWNREYRRDWYMEMKQSGFRERYTLFWHNHFVTETATYKYAVFTHRYLHLLRSSGFGDFKAFVRAVGLDQAMLIYLDGDTNQFSAPNENYARELLELFTMGPQDKYGNDNYTEDDVQEIARALTGWVIDWDNKTTALDLTRHDSEDKVVFGVTGDFGYDDIIDLIFSERAEQTAWFLALKLYKSYIYEDPDMDVVQELADEIIAHNFIIHPVIRKLLASEAFFSSGVIGSAIKSPVDVLIGTSRMFATEDSSGLARTFDNASQLMGQRLLSPPNVAGWPGYHDWLSTTTMPMRWLATDALSAGTGGYPNPDFIQFASELHSPSDAFAAFYLPTAIASHLLGLPLENVEIQAITDDFGGDLDMFPVPTEIVNAPAYVRNLAKAFLAGQPWYEWNLQNNGASNTVQSFVQLILKYPEFQLT